MNGQRRHIPAVIDDATRRARVLGTTHGGSAAGVGTHDAGGDLSGEPAPEPRVVRQLEPYDLHRDPVDVPRAAQEHPAHTSSAPPAQADGHWGDSRPRDIGSRDAHRNSLWQLLIIHLCLSFFSGPTVNRVDEVHTAVARKIRAVPAPNE